MTVIAATEIQFYLSSTTISAGNTGTGTPGSSLGKFMTTSQISATPLDNLFTDLTGPENAASQVDYQCLFLMNHTTSGNTMLSPFVWLPTSLFIPGGANIAVGVDPTGVVAFNSGTAQAVTIANATTAPAGVTSWFGPSSTFSAGLPIPNIPPNQVIALWFRRSATNSAAVNNDGFTLNCMFNSNA